MPRRERRARTLAWVLMTLVTVGGLYVSTLHAIGPRIIGAAVAIAIGWFLYASLTRARIRLLSESLTDPLTGLYNRRHLIERLTEETARALRSGALLSVAMIDIDDFKQYNDRHGHSMGDDALRAVARLLAGGMRRSDLAFRIGGEEFVLLMPDTALRDAIRALQRLAAPGLPVTFSAGIAQYPLETQDPQGLLELADARLLHAKHHGKGQAWTRDDPAAAVPLFLSTLG